MFDSYFDDALQDSDRMLRDELLESDKEGALEGNGALDISQTRVRKKALAWEFQVRDMNHPRTLLSHHA